MQVNNIEITTSPLSADRTCVRANVICRNNNIPPEVYWIDVPRDYSDYLSDSGDAWLLLLLPFAIRLGEPLEISRPVDRDLFLNTQELMRIWTCWYPHLKSVAIEADVQEQPGRQRDRATATLFSGGIDSWFTLLRHNGNCNQSDRIGIDDLLRILGLDIPLEGADARRALRDTVLRATSEFKTQYVEVATNLAKTRWWMEVDWPRVAHGCAFASVGHALSGRYSKVLIPSTLRYDEAVPWGTHPLTDPLLSSSRTKFIHDGAGFSRVEKTKAVAKSDSALNSLQVCWATHGYRNCGGCSKCYITMTTLFLLGALDRCCRFGARQIDKQRLTRIFTAEASNNRAFLREVRGLALHTDNLAVARAIDCSFKRSDRLEACLQLAKLPLRLMNTKWRRRLDWRIDSIFLRNSVL